MKVKTYNLEIIFPTAHIFHDNISRVALQRYLTWYSKNYSDSSYEILTTNGETKCR